MLSEEVSPNGIGLQDVSLADLKGNIGTQHRQRRQTPQQDQQFPEIPGLFR